MKKILDLLVCFLHPIAVVLIWIDLATRRDMAGSWKLAWPSSASSRSCHSSMYSLAATCGGGGGDPAAKQRAMEGCSRIGQTDPG
jgi:hypothetical protein